MLHVSRWSSILIVTSIGSSSAFAQSRITLASPDVSGQPNLFPCISGAISGNGRYVLFDSSGPEFVAGDTNDQPDLFRFDRLTDVVERVGTHSNGAQSAIGIGHHAYEVAFDLSADGRWIVFTSRDPLFAPGAQAPHSNVFAKDLATGQVVLVSRSTAGAGANADSFQPSISDDGRFVAFTSLAKNLVAGDDGLHKDVFVHDSVAGTTERVSIDSSGIAADADSGEPELSADGRFVVFESAASNLVPGDTNAGSGLEYDGSDVFVRDRLAGTTERVSVTSSGAEAQSGSYGASISADGRFVCFVSRAPDLVLQDLNQKSDAFLRDRVLGLTTLVSVGAGGQPATNRCESAVLSADGTAVALTTTASNLVPNDDNLERDVYVRDLARGTTSLLSRTLGGTGVDYGCYRPAISADGLSVAFQTGTNWFSSIVGYTPHVYVADRGATPPSTYCIAKPNSAGCLPAIGATGIATVAGPSGCFVHAIRLREDKPIQLVYGVVGPNAAPFHGGVLCVQPPLRRLALQLTAGSGTTPCSGTAVEDLNARIASGLDPALVAGQSVWCQFVGRDAAGLPGFEFTLTDAVRLGIEP
jgi:Tol biopolymer transport system component